MSHIILHHIISYHTHCRCVNMYTVRPSTANQGQQSITRSDCLPKRAGFPRRSLLRTLQVQDRAPRLQLLPAVQVQHWALQLARASCYSCCINSKKDRTRVRGYRHSPESRVSVKNGSSLCKAAGRNGTAAAGKRSGRRAGSLRLLHGNRWQRVP